MNILLSQRVQGIKPSPTLSVTAKANELRAAGRDIVSLGAGEPDFDTPDHIKEAAIKAIREGFTKYTAVDGTASLKRAVVEKFKRENGLEYRSEQVLVSVGGKHSFYNLIQALINRGEEVVIPAPYWVSYPDIVLLAEGQPMIVAAGIEQGFKLDAALLDAAINARTRLVVINSPSNPTGVMYSRAELAEIGEVLRDHRHVLIATDDMYEHITWGEEPFSNILNVCPDLYERTIVLNGVSKAYAMTGWRIGYAAGPAKLIREMKIIQSQSTSNPTSIAQVAAEAALTGDQGCIAPMVRAFKERHDYLVQALNALPGVQCLPGEGTFYSFPNVQGVIARLPGIDSDIQLAEYLLERVGVAVVPGTAFGAPGHLRLSFATSMAVLEEAMARLGKAFAAA